MTDYGELVDEQTIRFERLLPGPIERIWEYLTDGEKRAKWLCGGTTDPHVGGRIEMEFHNATLSDEADDPPPEKYKEADGPMSFGGDITAWDPPHKLAHTWDFEDDHSEVTYELETVGDQVLLKLTHRRLGNAEHLVSACGGWHTHLNILRDILNGKPAKAFWKTHTPLEAHYREQAGL